MKKLAVILSITTCLTVFASAGFWYYQPQIILKKLTKHEATLNQVLPPAAVRWALDRTATRTAYRDAELFKRDMKRFKAKRAWRMRQAPSELKQ